MQGTYAATHMALSTRVKTLRLTGRCIRMPMLCMAAGELGR